MPTIRLVPSNYGRSNTNYVTVTNPANMYNNTDHTANYCTLRGRAGRSNSNSTYYAFINGFNFDDVPDEATVTSFKIKIRAYRGSYQSTGSNYRICLASQASNSYKISNTAMSSDLTTTSGGQVYEIPTGSLTWSQIVGYGSNFSIDVPLRNSSTSSSNYPYVYVYGAEIEVTYTLPTSYNVTVSNSTSATVTADPSTVYEGESSEIRTDTISGISIKDNGTDITSQFTQHSDSTGTFEIENRGSYGFALSNGYYVSQNKGVSKSAAVCRVHFSLPVTATVTIRYINYAEATYDFGVFGNLDTALSTNYYAAGSYGATITDSSYKKACNTSSDNTSSVQTLTYSNVAAGDHYIDIKYSKDDASDANNDTLQFQITITYSQTVTYYAYTISNITGDHTIVVAVAAQEKLYIKVNGSWIEAAAVYKKISGVWVQQTDLTQVFESGVHYKTG